MLPDVIDHGSRRTDHMPANTTLGFFGSITRSDAPVLSLIASTCVQVLPPSFVRYTPRSLLAPKMFPMTATNTVFGFFGSMRTRPIRPDFSRPMCVQVLPASVDL